jgi:D-alanyl-D-alanine dipeptidase
MWSRLCAAALIVVEAAWAASATAQALPPGFIYLRDADPSIAQDIRYAGAHNFVGRPLPGYDTAECVLRDIAAHALLAVQVELVAQGLGLKVYDCYRPARAVQEMVRWARAGASDRTDQHFYPHVPRGALVRQGYIGAHSAHSTGLAVDVTLIGRPATMPARASGPCGGPPDDSLDMGTSFDCFDPQSYSTNAVIGAAATRLRALLIALMERHGFVNYRREWWHFTFSDRPIGAAAFDFPIVARPVQ